MSFFPYFLSICRVFRKLSIYSVAHRNDNNEEIKSFICLRIDSQHASCSDTKPYHLFFPVYLFGYRYIFCRLQWDTK